MNKYLQVPDEIIDLHGHTTDEARAVLDNLSKSNTSHVRIIVGKGIHSEKQPILRDFVKSYLSAKNIHFKQSKIQDGGEGALEMSFVRGK